MGIDTQHGYLSSDGGIGAIMEGENVLDQQSKKWVWIRIDELYHTALMRISSMTGRHPSDLSEEAVILFINDWARKNNSGDPIILAAKALQDNRDRLLVIQGIRALIVSQMDTPSEDTMETIIDLCASIGVDHTKLFEEMSANKILAAISRVDGNMISPVVKFLLENIPENDEIPVKALKEMAREHGIAESALNRTKQSMHIESKRRTHGWVWMWPEGFSPVEYITGIIGHDTAEDAKVIVS